MIDQRVFFMPAKGRRPTPVKFKFTVSVVNTDNGLTTAYPLSTLTYVEENSGAYFKEFPITIDWGDDTIIKINGKNGNEPITKFMHTYATDGEYTVIITALNGFFPTIESNSDEPATTYNQYFRNTVTSILSPLPFMQQPNLDNLIPMDGNLYYKLANCRRLQSVPENFFSLWVDYATSLEGFFMNCESIFPEYNYIPNELIKVCKKVTNCSFLFSGCSSIYRIPDSLFSDMPVLTTVNSAFQQCGGLYEAGQYLFSNDTNLLTIDSLFQYCTGLTSAMASIGDAPAVTSARNTFLQCMSLDYARYDTIQNLSNLTDVEGMYSGCRRIAALTNSFMQNGNLTNCKNTFSYCSSLTSIEARLFTGYRTIETLERCFFGCTSLTTIFTEMLTGCSEIKSVKEMFMGCVNLTKIPTHFLFDQIACHNYNSMFKNCYKAVIENQYIFTNVDTDSWLSTRFRWMAAPCDFTDMFHLDTYEQISLTTAPELWRARYGGGVISTGCFTPTTRFSNSADIPAAWS